jgi:DNA invertase Pin-like site-specific DNA recombinase
VLVIDDDLGKSGASAEGRAGFQRLVSEVSLDHVGLILGVEMSRLARSNADWHRLLELCAIFGTLIADLDGVYDPSQYNDRLLLGLKGTMSEAELHVLKQRMYQGALSKARRGELTFALPVGYVWARPGEIAFDPDEQVQHVVRLVFRTFDELGTLGGVLRYLATHDVRLGVRVREGPGKGELVWRRPNRPTLQTVLRHPIYAGSYVYGRRQHDPRRGRPGRPSTGRVVADPAAWHALLPGRCPAYISPDQYEANRARLRANRARAEAQGAVRDGPALLAGLVVCGRCGCRLGVHYGGRYTRHVYGCAQRRSTYGEPLCQHVAGPCLDAFVAAQALAALEPATLELSLAAAERVEQERAELDRLWRLRRERAAHEADRAARQYHACEPEHRLVARTLEHAWEAALAAQQRLEEEYARFAREQPRVLTADERAAIRRLAADIPALWHASTTTQADRKEVVRLLVDRVVVDAVGASERVRVAVEWAGGGRSDGEVVRPIQRLADLSYYPRLCERLGALSAAGGSAAVIAERLHAEGYRPARPDGRLGPQTVRLLQRQLGLRPSRPAVRARDALGADEWWAGDLADALGTTRGLLETWIRRGLVRAHQRDEPRRRWVIWADAAELARLRGLRQRPVADQARRRWTDPRTDLAPGYDSRAEE